MIKKTILLTIIILSIYSIAVFVKRPSLEVTYNQWQENVIKAQKYLYADSSFENVIVGSSLARRLVMDSLPTFYNLAFSAMGVHDGLKIITEKNVMPKRVFIEVNNVFKQADDNFTSTLFNPVLYNVRKYDPALREGKQPVFLIYYKLMKLVVKTEECIKSHFWSKKSEANNEETTFKMALSSTLKDYSSKPNQNKLDFANSSIDHYVNQLTDRGVEVIFFELPVSCEVSRTPLHKAVQDFFKEKYSKSKITYIAAPDCTDYKTSDGIHFTNADALRYTSYFKKAAAAQVHN